MPKPNEPKEMKNLLDKNIPWGNQPDEVDILREELKQSRSHIEFLENRYAAAKVQNYWHEAHVSQLIAHHEHFVRKMARVKGAVLGILGISKAAHRKNSKKLHEAVSDISCSICLFHRVLENFLEDHKIPMINLLEESKLTEKRGG